MMSKSQNLGILEISQKYPSLDNVKHQSMTATYAHNSQETVVRSVSPSVCNKAIHREHAS
jgi:hypothetical protein